MAGMPPSIPAGQESRAEASAIHGGELVALVHGLDAEQVDHRLPRRQLPVDVGLRVLVGIEPRVARHLVPVRAVEAAEDVRVLLARRRIDVLWLPRRSTEE